VEEHVAQAPPDTVAEIENFEQIASYLIPSPGDIPSLAGIDIYGRSLPLNGIIGGDHLIYIDFKKRYDIDARIDEALRRGKENVAANLGRCKEKAGIVVADVAGHRLTDALLALMLHQAFLLGAIYELDIFGEITVRLFENLNSRFFSSSSVRKYLTLLYGEISQDGRFRFISAAHPAPVVFSRKFDRFVDICPELLTTFPPIGTMPSSEDIDQRNLKPPLGFKSRYEVNEITLMGSGDILILFTDGLSEHEESGDPFFPSRLERVLRSTGHLSAREIFEAVQEELHTFSPPIDDITYVVIKRS
jgi:serine phosphatase RsbU (regulator of sigma subunit)